MCDTLMKWLKVSRSNRHEILQVRFVFINIFIVCHYLDPEFCPCCASADGNNEMLQPSVLKKTMQCHEIPWFPYYVLIYAAVQRKKIWNRTKQKKVGLSQHTLVYKMEDSYVFRNFGEVQMELTHMFFFFYSQVGSVSCISSLVFWICKRKNLHLTFFFVSWELCRQTAHPAHA